MASKGYAGSPQLCTCAVVTWNTNRGLTFSRVWLSYFHRGAQNFSQPPNSTFWTDKECSKECCKCVASEETTGRTKLLAQFYENICHAELWAVLFVFLFNMGQTFIWTYWHADICQICWSQVRWLTPNVLSLHVNFISWKRFANFCQGEYKLK